MSAADTLRPPPLPHHSLHSGDSTPRSSYTRSPSCPSPSETTQTPYASVCSNKPHTANPCKPSANPSFLDDCLPIDARTRSALLSDYLDLQPSDSLRQAAHAEKGHARTAHLFASRIQLARALDLDETPSEKELYNAALLECTRRATEPLPAAHRARELRTRQRGLLAAMYPSHPRLAATQNAINHARRRIGLLHRAVRDQATARKKLRDAANLLLLIADHIDLLAACYGSVPVDAGTASAEALPPSSDCSSSDEDCARVRCLGGRGNDDARPSIHVTSIPSTYRFRYLRKCWGFAAEAIEEAVKLSSFLAREMKQDGRRELVPGLEAQCKRCLWLVELPGGLTVVFRTEFLRRMVCDARRMRADVLEWEVRLEKFSTRVRRELGRVRRRMRTDEEQLARLRRELLEEEFSEFFREATAMGQGQVDREE